MQTSTEKDYSTAFNLTSFEKKKGRFAGISVSQVVTTFLIILFGVLSVLGSSLVGFKYIYQVFALSIGIPLLVYACSNLHVGVYIVFVFSFFILGIMRWVWQIGPIPTGVLMDALIFILLLAMIVHLGRKASWDFMKNPISIMVLVWVGYNIAQVANPASVSPMAWMISIRGIAGTILFYFFCVYAFSSFKKIDVFVQLWIFLSFLLGAYGLVQEVHGFFPFEEQWMRLDEQRMALIFNWGRYRRFSFFCDPTTFGITVAYSAVLCIVLGLGPANLFKKMYYFFCAGIMAVSMIFSGTRTAFVLIPAGILFLTILTWKRDLIIMSVLFFLVFAGILFSPIKSLGPIDNNALTRFRSAFAPDNDPSFQVRLKNQATIKPYIQSHPIGAGLGSVGEFGKKYNSPLGGFPPDSGFVKIAVELGWLGMLLYCVFLFFVFKVGVENYHKLTNPLYKNFQAAILSVLFALVLANYAQEAITMYPSSIIFYTCMAIVMVMPNLEKNEL